MRAEKHKLRWGVNVKVRGCKGPCHSVLALVLPFPVFHLLLATSEDRILGQDWLVWPIFWLFLTGFLKMWTCFEISLEIFWFFLRSILIKCVQATVSWTPNLFCADSKNQNFGSGPNGRLWSLNPCKKNLRGEKLCVQIAGQLPDAVESPNLQITGYLLWIEGFWAFCSLERSQSSRCCVQNWGLLNNGSLYAKCSTIIAELMSFLLVCSIVLLW